MSARMKDIAKDLGVSLMTVSKALRSHADISEETRRRVMQRARELDYRPNRIAQSLVNGRTFLVGLIIPDLMHSFFAEVSRGISKKLDPRGYQVVISNSEESAPTEDRQVELLMSQRVDGLIIASSHTNVAGTPLQRIRCPYVLIDRNLPDSDAHFIGVDDIAIGALATRHLIDLGHRRIAHIRGPEVGTGIGRFQGYRKAIEEAGMPLDESLIITGLHDDQGGYNAMRTLLERTPRPDAVFCYNDPVATGAIQAIVEAGLDVPGDIAVAGAGNVHYSRLLRVPLTTVDQSSTRIGESAADILLEAMESDESLPPRSILLPPRLIVRESTQGRA